MGNSRDAINCIYACYNWFLAVESNLNQFFAISKQRGINSAVKATDYWLAGCVLNCTNQYIWVDWMTAFLSSLFWMWKWLWFTFIYGMGELKIGKWMIAMVTGVVLLRLIRKQSIYHLIILSSDSVLSCPVIAVITF